LVEQAAFSLWRPVVCPTLIGRDALLGAIEQLGEAVRAGERVPRVLLIRGEAGVGKSRLLAAARAQLARRGWSQLVVAAAEPDQPLPLGVVVALLRELCAVRSPAYVVAALGPSAAAIAPLLPELGPHLNTDGSLTAADPAQSQRQLFHGLAQLCVGLTERGPLLLVVEDAHWADAASLAGLHVLAGALGALPVLLVLTAREIASTHPLAGLTADLARLRTLHELTLAPLARDELALMLQITLRLAHPVPADLLHALHVLTDGNPFFVEEVLSALLAAGQLRIDQGALVAPPDLPIPSSLRAAVQRHAAFLSREARELLELAAVIGRRFDFALLQRMLERPEAALIPPLKELIATGLLVEEAPDRLAFRHALARAVIAGDLLARERRGLHRRLGELLAAADNVALAGAASEHLYAAEAWEPALQLARRAAEEALRLYAPHEAIVHLTRALAAARHLPGVPTAELHHARGQAYETVGELAAAQTDYEAALQEARATGRRTDEWQALLDLGFLWLARDSQRAAAYLEQMLAVARTSGDPLLLGRSLNRVGNLALNQDDPPAALRYHREALPLFEQAGDQHGVAETLDLIAIAEYLRGNLAAGTVAFARAIDGFEALHDRFGLIHSLTHLGLRANLDTEPLDAAALAELEPPLLRALTLAEGMRWRTGETFVRTVLGLYLTAVGRYGEALAMLQASLQIALEIEHHWWAVQARASLGLLYTELLAPRRALAQLTPAMAEARASGLTMLIRDVGRYLVTAHLSLRAFTQAEAALTAGATPRDAGSAPSVPARQMVRAAAQLALARGDAAVALELVDGLIATAVAPGGVTPSLWWLRGEALLQLRRYGEAREALEAALAAARREGRRPLVWRIAAALANLGLLQRREQDAHTAAEEALATIAALAETLPDRALREAFAQRAAAAVPTVASQTHRQAVKQSYDGLTDRERDVARLLAQGCTNREVAAALVISERTVTTHISNILGKLGLSSRTQVARWAIDKGLA
jgi:DNA-binding CsgD family transcriptional regulator